jgi:hypothetical protein
MVKRHLAYLRYVLRHKWYVLVFGLKIFGRDFMWRGLTHDLSKFLPSEYGPYARTFYEKDGSKRYVETEEFSLAWRKHQIRNKHHWQYWLLTMDRGIQIYLDMPHHYIEEMIADWCGAGYSINSKVDVTDWYEQNRSNILVGHNTRVIIDDLVQVAQEVCGKPKYRENADDENKCSA